MTALPTALSMFDLSGRVALVTGASTGLGERFARVLHDAGATVVITARRAGARKFKPRIWSFAWPEMATNTAWSTSDPGA